jgi:redox-sensitive bicupin YhaK (pirin superfamily)
MTPPRYFGAQTDAIPAISANGATVHLISGEYEGQAGVIESLTGTFLCWVEAQAGAEIRFTGLSGRDVFLYSARGAFEIDGVQVSHFTLTELSEGDSVTITTPEPSLFLFGHAVPIDEPIVAHGPFVMNTTQEIHQAFADYQAGKFGVAEINER